MSRIVLASLFVLAVAGCKHVPQSAARKYSAAPRIENPLLGQAETRIPGLTSEPEAFLYSSFQNQELCFEAQNTQSPAEATSTRYSLRFLTTDEVDLKNAPSLKTSVARVLSSTSQLVPVTKTVQDVVRDAHGNTVATVSRQVQELETHYETQLRLCFPGSQQALTADARYMVLMRESGAAAASMWGIPMRPRSSWVWRFPAADSAPLTSASR
jgi:hypothetical protein